MTAELHPRQPQPALSETAMSGRPLALIAGLGEGLGAGLATTFAAAGYDIAGLSRSQLTAPAVEAAVREQGGNLLPSYRGPSWWRPRSPLPPSPSLLAWKSSCTPRIRFLIKPFAEPSPEEFEATWRVGCLGATLVARAVAPAMVARGKGTMIFTGATASIKGGPGFSAFASAKFALRGFAQALARELGPKGVHVAHVVLDGLIEEPQTTSRFGHATAARMEPDAIAAAYLALARQHRSAWTHEVDLRPFCEKF